MSSDTPRLPKGPKPGGPRPHKFVPDDSGRCIFYGCFKPKDDAIHVTAAQADADPPPGDPDTGN